MDRKSGGIIAVSTAIGRSGIGVVRFSGTADLAKLLVSRMTDIGTPRPRYAYFTAVRDGQGGVIDRGVVIWFRAPHSYTGEDVIEFQTHGNPVIQNTLIKVALEIGGSSGLRLAGPGEFTKKAFLNGRLDLAQAESVMDLINASSESAVRAAERSLEGTFSDSCQNLEKLLIDLRTNVEAILDFPEEEIDFIREGRIRERIGEIRSALGKLLLQAGQGSLLREGIVIALVGSPNVGKSSLLNRLSDREVAIVTDVPGTTRDLVENSIEIGGLQVRLVDTAGLRATDDIVEAAGIRRALSEVERADMILHLVAPETLDSAGALKEIKGRARPGTPVLTVTNKIDLLSEVPSGNESHLYISARTGYGIDRLKERILASVGFRNSVQGVFTARRRHIESLRHAEASLDRAADLIREEPCALDMVAEELRIAGDSFGEILGEFSSEDLLGRIFSTFCIGK